jgi:hypothetical protein
LQFFFLTINDKNVTLFGTMNKTKHAAQRAASHQKMDAPFGLAGVFSLAAPAKHLHAGNVQ